MDSRDLNKQQLDWLHKKLSAMTHELCLIHNRLTDLDFPQNDKLRLFVSNAYESAWTASQHAHALSWQGKMGTTYFFIGEDGCGRTEP